MMSLEKFGGIQGFDAGGNFAMLGGKPKRGRKGKKHGGEDPTPEEIAKQIAEARAEIAKLNEELAVTKAENDALKKILPNANQNVETTDGAASTQSVATVSVGGKKRRTKKHGGEYGQEQQEQQEGGKKRRGKKHGGEDLFQQQQQQQQQEGGKKRRTKKHGGSDLFQQEQEQQQKGGSPRRSRMPYRSRMSSRSSSRMSSRSPSRERQVSMPKRSVERRGGADLFEENQQQEGGKKRRVKKKHGGADEEQPQVVELTGGKKRRSKKHGGALDELQNLTAQLQSLLK
jgi:hypothetical protein